MLTDAEMHIATAVVLRAEIAGTFEGHARFGRRREIGGASDQPRQIWRNFVEHLPRRIAAGDALWVGREHRDVLVPSRRQLALLNLFALLGEVRMLGLVASKQRFPL